MKKRGWREWSLPGGERGNQVGLAKGASWGRWAWHAAAKGLGTSPVTKRGRSFQKAVTFPTQGRVRAAAGGARGHPACGHRHVCPRVKRRRVTGRQGKAPCGKWSGHQATELQREDLCLRLSPAGHLCGVARKKKHTTCERCEDCINLPAARVDTLVYQSVRQSGERMSALPAGYEARVSCQQS